MADLVITERFVADAAEVRSDRAAAKVEEAVRALETFPEMGSPDVPHAIRRRFGSNVRKLVAMHYDVIYEYDLEKDVATVYALIPCRAVC